MKPFLTNQRGQFTIIAAILVAIVLVGAVVSTYSAIRYSSLEEQPQVLSSIDEVNLALKQILGFTVGYYGSVLQVTGNTTYAKQLATNYLQSGLVNIGDVRPEWAPSFDITTLDLRADWYSNKSYSSGSLSVTYDLPGIGISGITYSISSRLDVQIQPSIGNQACLNITKDGSEPLVDIPVESMKFYRYVATDLTWEQVSPNTTPFVYANGTYLIELPSGVSPDSYMIKVEDSRGIMVVSSSFASYTGTLIRNSTYTGSDYVDNISTEDTIADIGTHSSFPAQQQPPDTVYDTLTESADGGASPINIINESFEEGYFSDNWDYHENWEIASDYSVDGTKSARFDENGDYGYIGTRNLDCSDATSIIVDFWYMDSGCERNEFYLYYYNGAHHDWDPYSLVNQTTVENEWIHFQAVITDSHYRRSDFRLLFEVDSHTWRDSSPDIARVDLVNVSKVVDSTTYQLDLEEQWTNVNYTNPNQDLCIKTTNPGSETLLVDVWHDGGWVNVGTLSGLVSGWKNISVATYIDSSNFTIRFRDSFASSDSSRTSWQIDAVLLAAQPDANLFLSQQDSTVVIEWLQNGTMRWLGQNIELTTEAKPIPPIPVKNIHLNQTINGVNQEVAFQIEDWSSEYRIPLGLTSNATVFSNRQMIVFLVDAKVSEFTLWWTGNDEAVQTPLAYTNSFFDDDIGVHTLDNNMITLQFSTAGFTLTSEVRTGTVTTTASLMRINGEYDDTAPELSYAIYNGVVRDIVLGEAEYSGGISGSPNVYTNIVISLPANLTYYTYQLRLMFLSTSETRTLTEVRPIALSTSPSPASVETENGTASGFPIVQIGYGTFGNDAVGGWTAHHWSQLISSDRKRGSGIMFTDSANMKLYAFDTMPGSTSKGAIVTSSNSIELLPVRPSVTFGSALDITWSGAVVTFDNKTPVCATTGATSSGLWILVEYPPTITVVAKS